MPRNVRNFWLETRVDGRDTDDETGPRGKDGGFRQTIYIRENGDVSNGLSIQGYLDDKTGENVLVIWDNRTSAKVYELRTAR